MPILIPKNNGDVINVKYRDILNEDDQNELELISDKIKEFNPDKIFIEYPYDLQDKLDPMYTSFRPVIIAKKKRDENGK